jgi:hypothetical protein
MDDARVVGIVRVPTILTSLPIHRVSAITLRHHMAMAETVAIAMRVFAVVIIDSAPWIDGRFKSAYADAQEAAACFQYSYLTGLSARALRFRSSEAVPAGDPLSVYATRSYVAGACGIRFTR